LSGDPVKEVNYLYCFQTCIAGTVGDIIHMLLPYKKRKLKKHYTGTKKFVLRAYEYTRKWKKHVEIILKRLDSILL